MTEFSELPQARLLAMAEAGRRIQECYRVLRKSSSNVVAEILRGQGDFFEWDHYPKGDVYDFETHAQYYYHAHPIELRGGEHGHFHTFLRPKGMPAGIMPAKVPDYVRPTADNDALSHLIGISMDRSGYPVRLFTTNRWVTGETWYSAEDVIAMLDRFNMDMAWPSWPTNIWVSSMLVLFRPQIEDLVRQRDVTITDWAAKNPDGNTFEDRELEVTSIARISVEGQIEAVEASIKEPA